MKVIIDIDEKDYKYCKDRAGSGLQSRLEIAVADGTPLTARDMVEVIPQGEVLVGDVVESTYYTRHMPEGIKGVVISVEHHQQGADAYRILWADGRTSTEWSDDFKQTDEHYEEMRTVYSKIRRSQTSAV